MPPDLVDNAAVIGTLTLLEGLLFLLDLGGPRAKKEKDKREKIIITTREPISIKEQVLEIEKEVERNEGMLDIEKKKKEVIKNNGSQHLKKHDESHRKEEGFCFNILYTYIFFIYESKQ